MAIFGKVRKRIDRVINKLLKKAQKVGRKLMGKLGIGAKEKPKNPKEHYEQVKAGMMYLHQQEKALDKDGNKSLSEEEATKVASKTKKKFAVFTSITPRAVGGKWVYDWKGSSGTEKGAKVEGGSDVNSVSVSKGDLIKAKYQKGRFLADVEKIDGKKKQVNYKFRYKDLTKRDQIDTFEKFNEKWKSGEIEKVNQERQHLIKNRPKYESGLVEKVWINAMDSDKRVFDPNIRPRKELFWNKEMSRFNQWHMGHRKKHKYSDLVDKYINGDKTYDDFIKDYNNEKNYYPEDPKSNMSHKFE